MATYLSNTGSNTPQYYDPLGTDTSSNGGQAQRNVIYDQMDTAQPMIQQSTADYVKALQSAATNPERTNEMDYEKSVLNGDYLNGSPALDNAMSQLRDASSRAIGDANAKTDASYAQNGMSFGTGNQEAQMANTALENSQTNQTEANARLQNYQTERGYQNSAPATIESLIQAPTTYLSAVPTAYTSELTNEANIVKSLSGGGSVATPSTYQTSSGISQTGSGIGSL
jgi:hypothetical protein